MSPFIHNKGECLKCQFFESADRPFRFLKGYNMAEVIQPFTELGPDTCMFRKDQSNVLE